MRFGGVCVQWSRRSAQEPDKWVYFERDSREKKNKKKELFKRRTDFFLSSVHTSGGCRSDGGCGGGDGDSCSFRATDSLQGQDKDRTRTRTGQGLDKDNGVNRLDQLLSSLWIDRILYTPRGAKWWVYECLTVVSRVQGPVPIQRHCLHWTSPHSRPPLHRRRRLRLRPGLLGSRDPPMAASQTTSDR